jgi:Flp pilus assembly pilin Flp
MCKLFRVLKAFFARVEGASLAEYAVGLLLIAVITIAGISLLGNAISSFFVSMAGTV